jgi:hypothetical protein
MAWAQGQSVTFSAVGDVPYSSGETTTFQQQIPNHNKYSPSAFFVHVGDIASAGNCAETQFSLVSSIMKGLKVPVYVVTGDNEIVDCKNPTAAWALWLKYYKSYYANFCGAPVTEQQSDNPSNFAFVKDGVLFIGIDLAGRSGSEQIAADWIKQQLQAKGSQVRAAVAFSHFPPNGSTTFSTPFRQTAAAFGKPVLFLHGHGHSWSVGFPFPEKNIMKVQVAKGASEDPVQFTVTMNTSSPSNAFVIKRKPWALKAVVNMPPCANAGPDQELTHDANTLTLKGSASDDGDPQGATITTTWSKVSGPGVVTFGNPNALTTLASFNAPGTYVLRLTANDTQLEGSDDVTITTQGAATPVFTINDVTVNEGDAGSINAIFTVTLANSNGFPASVNYKIVDGTAAKGSDYFCNPDSGTLNFSSSIKRRKIWVTIHGDEIDEQNNETFFVNLSNAVNATIADGQGIATIINDDMPIPPQTPGNVLAKTTGASSIDVSWTDFANNEDGFKLERKAGAGPFALIATLGPNVNFYNDSGLSSSTVYSYRLYAFNNVGSSIYSNTDSTETASNIVENPSTNMALNDSATASSTAAGYPAANAVDGDSKDTYWRSGSAIADSAIKLVVDLGHVQVVGRAVVRWKDTYYATNYALQVSNNNVKWATVYSTSAGKGGDEEFMFTPTLARYVRLAMTFGPKGSYRILEFELYSGGLNAPPQAPTNLVANATSHSTLSISWNHSSNDEYGFEIERAINGGTFRYLATLAPNSTFYNDGGLSANTTYVYRVRAYNFIDDSDYSNQASATTLNGSGPGPNPNLNLALQKTLTASSTDPLRPVLAAADSNITTWWSSATNKTVWLSVDLGAARAVGRAVVKWQDVYYAKTYDIQVSNDALSWITVQSVNSGSSGVQDLAFAQILTRYVRIYMTSANKSTYQIQEFEIYAGAPSKSTTKRHAETAADAAIPQEFVLEQNYPNPFSSLVRGTFGTPSTQIRFGLPQASHVAIKLYTLTGSEVRTLVDAEYPAGRHTITFHAKNLPSGTYFYVMQAGAVRQVRRLMLLK